MNISFFFNDTATTEIYTLSLHDALPISTSLRSCWYAPRVPHRHRRRAPTRAAHARRWSGALDLVVTVVLIGVRSEEHTSELQSRQYLVCRLLLEKKNFCRLLCYWRRRPT